MTVKRFSVNQSEILDTVMRSQAQVGLILPQVSGDAILRPEHNKTKPNTIACEQAGALLLCLPQEGVHV